MSGHCVHSGGPGGTPTSSMTFAPGRNGGSNPYGTCPVTQLATTSQWLNSANANHDWGMGQLNCNVGNTVGWLGYRSLSTNALLNRLIEVRGYPGDKASGTMWTMQDRIRFLSGNNLSVHYRADTAGGQSGSPVYEPTGCGGGPCGLAIHSYGCPNPGAGCPAPGNHNSGPRITAGRFDTIYNFGAQNDDHPDALVRRLSGGFVGNNRVNLSGSGQSLTDLRIPRGTTRRHVVRIENDGGTSQDFRVRGTLSSSRFQVRWFTGSTNITSQVRAGTYTIPNLAPGAHVDLRVEIKVLNSTPSGARVTATTRATATNLPGYADAVRSTVRAR